MAHDSAIPVVVAEGDRDRPDSPSWNPSPPGTPSPWTPNPILHDWTLECAEPRGLALDDGDESMSSSAASFDATLPLRMAAATGGIGSHPWPSPGPARLGPGALSAIGLMNLRDGPDSPMPPALLEPAGEELCGYEQEIMDGASPDIFGMELPEVEEDALMANFLPSCVTPTWPEQELSSFPFPAERTFPRRHTDPSDMRSCPPPLASSFPPFPSAPLPGPHRHQGAMARQTSTKRTRSQRRSPRSGSSGFCRCDLPGRPKQGQKLLLPELPIEILLEIFRNAMLWPPVTLPKCKHQLAAAASGSRPPPPAQLRTGSSSAAAAAAAASSSAVASSSPLLPERDPDGDSEEARKFGIRTLIKISHTCRYFYDILARQDDNGWTDETFWSAAAHACWGWLPNLLGEVQGRRNESQTSWRNLVEVFMQSENPLFALRKEGKGGVDCFGENRSCYPAASWSTEKTRRRQMESDGRRPRSLALACAQPGPDPFAVTPDEDSAGWTVALSLRGGEYLVHLDEYGRFGRAGRPADDGLRRSDNVGYFAPDIFEDSRDRFRLVKAQVRREPHAPQFSTGAQGKPIGEAVTWDLSSIPEFVADPQARVARCDSHGRSLLCTLFTHRNPSELDELVDPPEDPRIFCIEAEDQDSSHSSHAGALDCPDGMSSRRRGKLPEKKAGGGSVFRWQREFEYRDPAVLASTRQLHYVVCNLRMAEKSAVVLVRWNQSTRASLQEFYDGEREFHILNPDNGETSRVLEFPNLYWDYRHNDMDRRYNIMRVNKLNGLYNPPSSQSMGSGNRATRIHQDAFFVTDRHILSGSHDYCSWVWDLDKPACARGTYTAEHNDASHIPEPFEVLDDYYWGSKLRAGEPWALHNERAGWWVKTPNQVLCYWHGAAVGLHRARFATCRTGKMFVWNLDVKDRNSGIRGYTSLAPQASERQGWLGRLRSEQGAARMDGWYLYDDVVPEQGLWLLYDGDGDGDGDDEAVFLDRDEILEACGLEHESWRYERDMFVFDETGRDTCDDGDDGDDDDDDDDLEVEEAKDLGGKRQKIGYRRDDGDCVPLWDCDIDIDID